MNNRSERKLWQKMCCSRREEFTIPPGNTDVRSWDGGTLFNKIRVPKRMGSQPRHLMAKRCVAD
jgi:hypothetical protein